MYTDQFNRNISHCPSVFFCPDTYFGTGNCPHGINCMQVAKQNSNSKVTPNASVLYLQRWYEPCWSVSSVLPHNKKTENGQRKYYFIFYSVIF
jgi:hypothetical protein